MSKYSKAWMMFLLFSGLLITGIDRSNISIASPAIMKELNLNAGLMGIVFSSFFWAYLVFNIPSGILADRYGAKKVYAFASTLWSAVTLLTGAVTSFVALIACRFGLGIGEAVVFPVSAKIVNEYSPPEQRGTVTGIYMAGYRLGMAICPMIIATIVVNWGWKISFYISGVLSLLWVVVWVTTYPKQNVVNDIVTTTKKFDWKVMRGLLSQRNTLALIVIKFLSDYLVYLIITWLPGYLVMERHFSLLKMGIYASLPWIAGMIALPLVGLFSDYLIVRGKSRTFARKGPLIFAQLMASSIVFVNWVDSPMVAVWLLVFVVAAESAVSGVLWTIPPEIAESGEAATLAGVMNTAGSLAGILSPMVTGFIIMFTGSFTAAFVVAGTSIILSALSVAFLLGEIKPRSELKGC